MKARQRPGGAGRVGDGEPRRQAEIFFEPRRKIGDELFLAAEKMRGAFDVEEKTVGAVLLAPRRRRSAYSASPTAPGGAARRHRRRHRWRAPAACRLSRARRPMARRARARRLRPPRSRRRCAARRRRRWRGRTARSGSTGLSEGFFACAARMRRIGQRGSQTETMRDMIVLHYPFARASVAAAFKLSCQRGRANRPKRSRAAGAVQRRASASPPRSIPGFAPAAAGTAAGRHPWRRDAAFGSISDRACRSRRRRRQARAERNASSMAQRVSFAVRRLDQDQAARIEAERMQPWPCGRPYSRSP